jgi:hypothetical protein
MFRRVVLHLSAIQDRNRLYAEPMIYERTWTIPADSVTGEGFKALEQQYDVTYDLEQKTYTLRKTVMGRVLITNYDPDTLLPEERVRLSKETEDWSSTNLAFDIRPGHPGGEWPMKGYFRLRSFRAILTAVGLSLAEEAEYDVALDPRSPPVLNNENPVRTVEIVASEAPPLHAERSIHTHGKFYSMRKSSPQARWNRLAFQLMFDLYQMTITDMPRQGAPFITIGK